MAVDVTALAIKVTSEGIKEASQALGGLSTSASNASKRVDTLISAMERLNTVNRASAKATQESLGGMNKQVLALQEMNLSLKGAANGVGMLGASLTLLATTMAALNANLEAHEKKQRASNASMAEAHALARGLSGSLGALWVTYGNFAGMAAGLAIGASLKGIVTIGKDVEHTLEAIRVRGNETVETVGRLREAVYDLGRGVYGPQEVAKAFEILVLAGLKAEQALSSVNAVMNLAVAGGVEIEKAASTLVSVGTAVGYTAEGFGRVGDVIAKTAALSMSSVETLSEAFKSASSVNKLYGVTLEDIGTSLGVLSNLGIQGSAAGTALKNMYKELASEADKVQNTFKKLGLNSMSLKDSEGNFKPLLDVVKELDGALNKLSGNEEKLAIARLSNERGLRLITQALREYRRETSEGRNALQDFRENVENSYGFAAKAAVQLSLTADSQIKSMMNTLRTAFAEAFTSMQPQILIFAQRMKTAFSSEGFRDTVKGIATAFGNLAMAIGENIKVVTMMIGAFVALKAAMAINGLITMVAEGMTALAAASTAAATAASRISIALGAVGVVLGTLTVLWTAYHLAKGDPAKEGKDAEAYAKGYIEGLNKEAENLERVNQKLREKKTLTQANKEVEQENARMELARRDSAAVMEAQLRLDKAEKAAALTTGHGRGNANAARNEAELAAARLQLAQATKLQAEHSVSAAEGEKRLYTAAKENAELAESEAKKAKDRAEAMLSLTGDLTKGEISDKYARDIAEQANLIKAARQTIESEQRTLTNAVKAGSMGRMEAINREASVAAEQYAIIGRAINEQIRIAANAKNKGADVERFQGDRASIVKAAAEAEKKAAEELAVYVADLERQTTRHKIKELEDQGKYVEAATLRWSSEYSAVYEAASKDAEKYGEKFPVLIAYAQQLADTQKQMIASAGFRELADQADVTLARIGNGLRNIVVENEGQGLTATFKAALAATEEYKAALPGLQAELEKVRKAADESGNPQDKKRYEDLVAKQMKNAKDFGKLWSDVAGNIGKHLELAFGKSGKVAGDMVKTIMDYSNQQNQGLQAQMTLYANLSGQAAQFFDKQSTGYKVLNSVSKAFYLAETAMALASIAPKIAAGAATMFAQSGWGGFAGVAAMMGVMAALGYSGSSGGAMSAKDRQEQQGKGSVLGDADKKSESILKALEHLEKNSGLGLAHSNEANRYLKSIASSMAGLASLIVRTTGLSSNQAAGVVEGSERSRLSGILDNGFTNVLAAIPAVGKLLNKLFGTTTTLVDQGIQIAKESIESIMQSGVDAQGYATVNTKKKFFGVSYSNKTSDQLSNLPNEVTTQFSLVIENMASGLKSMADMMGVGGDAFTNKLKSFVVDIGKISFKDMKGDEVEKALQNIFSKLGDDMAAFALGGLQEFQKVGEGYYETVARVANNFVQVSDVLAVLGKKFNVTGLEAVKLSESLIEAAGGLEKLTEGTKFFVENFLTEAEQMAPIVKSVTDELNRLGLGNIKTVEQFKNVVQAQDLSTKAGQEMYAALINLAPSFLKTAEYAKKLAEGMDEATQEMIDAQQKLVDEALNRADMAYKVLEKSVNRQKDVVRSNYESQLAILNAQKAATQAAYEAQRESIQNALSAEKEKNQKLAALQTALKTALDAILPTIVPQAVSRAAAMANLDKALADARNGKFATAESMQGTLSELTKPSDNLYTDYNAYKLEQGRTAVKLSEFGQLTGRAKSASDRMVESLERQLKIAEEHYKADMAEYEKREKLMREQMEAELASLDAILQAATAQVEAINGTTIAVQSLQAALSGFAGSINSAIGAMASASAATGGAVGGGVVMPAQGTAEQNAAFVNGLYKNILGREAEKAGFDFWTTQLANGVSANDVIGGFYNSDEYKAKTAPAPTTSFGMGLVLDGSHASGLDYVPKDNYLARLHEGEMVVTAEKAQAMRRGDEIAEMREAIEQLREDNSAENQSLVSDMRYVKKLLQNASPDGTSLQVKVVT